MWRNLLSAIGSYASLGGLYYTVRPPGLALGVAEQFLLVLSLFLILAHLGIEVSAIWKARTQVLRTDADVKSFMRSRMSLPGRTVLLSRDISWVDAEMEIMLGELAGRGNLSIFMEKENVLGARMRNAGADIHYYEHFRFLPATRFAITNEGRADARVVMGSKTAHGLEIKEYTSGHPVFHLCCDVVSLLRTRRF